LFLFAGVAAVMLARSAQANPSVFAHPKPLTPIDEVICEYIHFAVQYDMIYQNTKYVLMQMCPDMKTEKGKKLASCKNLRSIASLWNMELVYDKLIEDRRRRELTLCKEFNNLGHHDWNKNGGVQEGTELECRPWPILYETGSSRISFFCY
jgi:tRNA-dihydrouridine synthase